MRLGGADKFVALRPAILRKPEIIAVRHHDSGGNQFLEGWHALFVDLRRPFLRTEAQHSQSRSRQGRLLHGHLRRHPTHGSRRREDQCPPEFIDPTAATGRQALFTLSKNLAYAQAFVASEA